MIREKDWKWFGLAGHFICGHYCRFHLCTQVGEYLISTVGNYFPDSLVREIVAQRRGITLEGKGDYREDDYLKKVGYEDIGHARKFETMVFMAGKPCTDPECNCGQPSISGSELDFKCYNTVRQATEGHLAVCNVWANKG